VERLNLANDRYLLVFRSERRLRRRILLLGEVPEGAV
jgi:hypothetical protein